MESAPRRGPSHSPHQIRKAYEALRAVFPAGEEARTLAAKAFDLSPAQLATLLQAPAAQPGAQSGSQPGSQPGTQPGTLPGTLPNATPRPTLVFEAGKGPTLHDTVPKAEALLALRQFALRDATPSLSLFVALPGDESRAPRIRQLLQEAGFSPLPPFELQNPQQRWLIAQVSSTFFLSRSQVCCGVATFRLGRAAEKYGFFSAPHLPRLDQQLETFLDPLRRLLEVQGSQDWLHYACLPPLDLARLCPPATPVPLPPTQAACTLLQRVEPTWLRGQGLPPAFTQWFAERYPQGTSLGLLLREVPQADWLATLLTRTLHLPATPSGKRVLVRIALLCAQRAQRWCQRPVGKVELSVAERWCETPGEELRELAGQAIEELLHSQTRLLSTSEGHPDCIARAAGEAVLQALTATQSLDGAEIASATAHAAEAAVLAASFAACPNSAPSWLDGLTPEEQQAETTEHLGLCYAIRTTALHQLTEETTLLPGKPSEQQAGAEG